MTLPRPLSQIARRHTHIPHPLDVFSISILGTFGTLHAAPVLIIMSVPIINTVHKGPSPPVTWFMLKPTANFEEHFQVWLHSSVIAKIENITHLLETHELSLILHIINTKLIIIYKASYRSTIYIWPSSFTVGYGFQVKLFPDGLLHKVENISKTHYHCFPDHQVTSVCN